MKAIQPPAPAPLVQCRSYGPSHVLGELADSDMLWKLPSHSIDRNSQMYLIIVQKVTVQTHTVGGVCK